MLTFLRTRTGRDFSYYKRATILRRISRRMQVNGVDHLPEYLEFLRTHPGETGALLQDLLITVTNFFRDRETFAALEERIPELFAGKGRATPCACGSPACATGEEAYSIAMLLLRARARRWSRRRRIQVFATDLDEEAIRRAREGIYPLAIAADVARGAAAAILHQGARRLSRAPGDARDRALRRPRSAEGFAFLAAGSRLVPQPADLPQPRGAEARVRDFPFRAAAGRAAFPRHSESMDEESPLFAVLDKKHRIYAQRPVPASGTPALGGYEHAAARDRGAGAGQSRAVHARAGLRREQRHGVKRELELSGERRASRGKSCISG